MPWREELSILKNILKQIWASWEKHTLGIKKLICVQFFATTSHRIIVEFISTPTTQNWENLAYMTLEFKETSRYLFTLMALQGLIAKNWSTPVQVMW